jgi:hypothetical protein
MQNLHSSQESLLFPWSAGSLEQLLEVWKGKLKNWALQGAISRAATDALGLTGEPQALQALVSQWAAGDFLALPPLVLLPAGAMPGAAGAYATTTRTIYLNQDWLQENSTEQALAVLTEELGHHLDGLLHATDTPGDEGELFAALLLDPAGLSGTQQEGLRQQDDHASLPLAGGAAAPLAVEMAASIPSYQMVSTPIPPASLYRTRHESKNLHAFAALRSDGSVITWGDSLRGGNSKGVDFDGPANSLKVSQIFSTFEAFAALHSDGSVVTWGDPDRGGNSSEVDFDGPSNSLKVSQIFSTMWAFAALRSDGSVVTWGQSDWGGNSSGVDFDGPANTLKVSQIFSSGYAFAALRSDGSVVTWGSSDKGGNSNGVDFDGPSNTLKVSKIFSTAGAFAALRSDGSVATWGRSDYGGSSSGVDFDGPSNTLKVNQIFSTERAFAAIRSDGSVVTWGAEAPMVTPGFPQPVQSDYGGKSSGLDFDLSS